MPKLAFFSRVAFICNCCLLLVALMRYLPAMPESAVSSTVIIAGLVLSFLVNALVNILYAVVLLRKQNLRVHVPVWLAVANFLFLIVQLYLVIK
ncbi:MAG: hypothetical protein WCF67_03805 [Chitinophagaceae bacterium]